MSLFGLVLDTLNPCPDGFLITQVVPTKRVDALRVFDGLKVLIQVIHKGDTFTTTTTTTTITTG